MKNLFKYIVPAALLVVAASCVKETGADTIPANTRKYSITIDQPTRTELSGSGSTRSVSWSEGDAIKYYTEAGQKSAGEASVKLNESGASVEIPRSQSDAFVNAVYGAAVLDSESSTANTMYVSSPLKDNQTYTSFSQAHLCAAFSDDLENPNLQFHNAAAILKFTSTSTIHKVVFYGNNNEVITGGSNGDLKISYADGLVTTEAASTGGTSITVQTNGAESDFYMAVIPVVFSEGITVDCYDSDLELIATKTTMNEISTVSSAGTPKVINLGSVQDWMANSQPEAVDLGLSVKWASWNVGATKPEEYGDYFAWGETEPKGDYRWSTYKWCNGSSSSLTKYNTDSSCGTVDNKTVLAPEDDAAHVNWGGDWRMPTLSEWQELIDNCTWTWTSNYNGTGVAGRIVTSNMTGYTDKSIFLPAEGYRVDTGLNSAGSYGDYWSSSLYTDYPPYALYGDFDSGDVSWSRCFYRFVGFSVRPVQGAVVPVASIEIPKTLDLTTGRTALLYATILPENATYKSVSWSSSDESIATVDVNGKVTAVSIGSANITVYSADASKTATCKVTVSNLDLSLPASAEAIDLGLSVKWATCNVGATKPEEYGEYFAWGETEPKEDYSWSTYKWCNGAYNKLIKHCPSNKTDYWDGSGSPDNKTVLDLEDDAAHVNWGGDWRMPSDAEWTELRTNCTWTWTDDYNGTGVAGRIVTSNKIGYTDKSIFLPAAGFRDYFSYLYSAGSYGDYWSSSLDTDFPSDACRVHFYSGDVYWWSSYDRCYGFSVRSVSE